MCDFSYRVCVTKNSGREQVAIDFTRLHMQLVVVSAGASVHCTSHPILSILKRDDSASIFVEKIPWIKAEDIHLSSGIHSILCSSGIKKSLIEEFCYSPEMIGATKLIKIRTKTVRIQHHKYNQGANTVSN